jgi:hypothetical protein
MDQTDVFLMSTGSFAGPEWLYDNTTYNAPYAPGTYVCITFNEIGGIHY